MNPKIIYTAYFVDDINTLIELFPPKHEVVFGHHSTIAFRPKDLEGISIGNKMMMEVIGRVFDEKGDALLVKNPKSAKQYPHITLSCAQAVPPVYSDEMIIRANESNAIEYFQEAILIPVTEGYFNGTQDITV